MRRFIPKAFALIISLLALPSFLTAQNDATYEFAPDYTEGEKWIVTYQSQYDCRFQIFARGKILSRKQVNQVVNRKYVKTFASVRNDRPETIEHFYVRANRKTKKGADQKRVREQLPYQGANVFFQWNADAGTYNVKKSSLELPEEVQDRLDATELYEYFLPEKPVRIGAGTWSPNLNEPVSVLFGTKQQESPKHLLPGFQSFTCELSTVREQDNRKIALISILMNSGKAKDQKEENVKIQLSGELHYDLTRQKPVKFSLSSRPSGISFRRSVDDGEVRVKDMGVFFTVDYDTTSSEGGNENSGSEKPQEEEEEKEETSSNQSSSDSSSPDASPENQKASGTSEEEQE